jgi:hypothetical protein
MVWPIIFGNLPGGNQPLSDFDTMFTQVAQMIAIPCTATGVNLITLTPITNAPTIPAYAPFCSFTFLAPNNSTGNVSATFGGLATLNCYRSDGITLITSGDIIAGQLYTLVYSAALNSGNGGFYLTRATVSPIANTGGSSFNGLVIANNVATPDTKIDVTIAEVVVVNTSGIPIFATGVAVTIDTTVSGVVNGMDTGVLAAAQWYYVYAISNGSTVGALLSLQSAGPALPAGYTFKKRLGAVRTDTTDGRTQVGITISQASPGVVTWNLSALPQLQPVVFTTTGSLPAPLVPGTTYYVINPTANTFNVSATPGAAPINTTSAGSGTHTATLPAIRLMRTRQLGRDVQYVIQAAPVPPFVPPVLQAGVAGTYSSTSPALQTVSVAGVVPPTATSIKVLAGTNWVGGTLATVLVAPSATWGALNTGPAGLAEFTWPIALPATLQNASADMVLESSNIAWASSAAGGVVACLGWRDNV